MVALILQTEKKNKKSFKLRFQPEKQKYKKKCLKIIT